MLRLTTMESIATFLLLALVAATLSSAIPRHDEHKRVVNKELSDEKHYAEGEEHNPEYDHEAFLGKETARSFDELTPEESKKRLGLIYDKIDKDGDGFVTEEELQNWVMHVQNRHILTDTNLQWQEQDVEGDKLTWTAYKTKTYGDFEEKDGGEGTYDLNNMISRDERRWKKADLDGDGVLSKEEFSSFLHPEDVEHMRETVVQETLEDIDKDKDGSISLEEYIGDMWSRSEGEEEPEWVKNEREQFTTLRDKNGDGKMDHEEVRDWIIPPNYDHSNAEAKHLVLESDKDGDKKLTKEEVLDKYDLFVGSQATDFGEALTKHDEF